MVRAHILGQGDPHRHAEPLESGVVIGKQAVYLDYGRHDVVMA